MKKLAFMTSVILLAGCGATSNNKHGVSANLLEFKALSEVQIYSGEQWPDVEVKHRSSQASGNIKIDAFTDKECLTAAPGQLTVAQNSQALQNGRAVFTGVTYENGGVEESVYLKATIDGHSVSGCSELAVKIVPHHSKGCGSIAKGKASPKEFKSGDASASATAIDSEGRVIVAGYRRITSGAVEMTLSRFLPDGGSDQAFGTNGTVALQSVGRKFDHPTGLQIDQQGRYVVSGITMNANAGCGIAVWRFNSDGSLDSTFGQSGRISMHGEEGRAVSATSGPDTLRIDVQGRIIVAGAVSHKKDGREMSIWRVLDNGHPDPSFGGGRGMVMIPSISGQGQEEVLALKIDSTGRYLLTGKGMDQDRSAIPVWRFHQNGEADLQFGGGNGYVLHAISEANQSLEGRLNHAVSLAFDKSGRMLLALSAENIYGGTEVGIMRCLEDGELDLSFGKKSSGYVILLGAKQGWGGAGKATKREQPSAMFVDSYGRIILAGITSNTSGGSQVSMWRLNSIGEMDHKFGGRGFVTLQDSSGVDSADRDEGVWGNLAVDHHGRYVLAGWTSKNKVYGGGVWRFGQDGSQDL